MSSLILILVVMFVLWFSPAIVAFGLALATKDENEEIIPIFMFCFGWPIWLTLIILDERKK